MLVGWALRFCVQHKAMASLEDCKQQIASLEAKIEKHASPEDTPLKDAAQGMSPLCLCLCLCLCSVCMFACLLML